MSGMTSSFAGKPRMNASSITPSIPNTRAAGSKNAVMCDRDSCIPYLHIGEQPDEHARRSRHSGGSRKDEQRPVAQLRTITRPICGMR